METATISKNEASPKSHTSRGNFLRYIFALLIVSILFVGCKKDDEGGDSSSGNAGLETLTISGKIVYVYDGKDINPDNVTKVVVYQNWNDAKSGRNAITETTVTNRQFSLTLTTPPTNGFISVKSMLEDFSNKSLLNQLSISNPSAQSFIPEIYAVWTTGIAYMYKMTNNSPDSYYEYYCYVDSDVSITGTIIDGDYKYVYDLNFKKGWNVMGEASVKGSKTWTYKNSKMRNDLVWEGNP